MKINWINLIKLMCATFILSFIMETAGTPESTQIFVAIALGLLSPALGMPVVESSDNNGEQS